MQPTRLSPRQRDLAHDLAAAVRRFDRAAAAHEGMLAIDAIGEVHELWSELRPSVELRAAHAAESIDAALRTLHLTQDPWTRRAGCAEALASLLDLASRPRLVLAA